MNCLNATVVNNSAFLRFIDEANAQLPTVKNNIIIATIEVRDLLYVNTVPAQPSQLIALVQLVYSNYHSIDVIVSNTTTSNSLLYSYFSTNMSLSTLSLINSSLTNFS